MSHTQGSEVPNFNVPIPTTRIQLVGLASHEFGSKYFIRVALIFFFGQERYSLVRLSVIHFDLGEVACDCEPLAFI
jgi:hypothetical protein